jgi:hypothetical protein
MPQSTMKIIDVLRTVFPTGTNITELEAAPNFDRPPLLAADNFAFCGYLIGLSGLMGRFDPGKDSPSTDEICHIFINQADHDRCLAASKEWRNNGLTPAYVDSLWDIISAARKEPILPSIAQKQALETERSFDAPRWWRAVFELAIIADEACEALGHSYTLESENQLPDIQLYRTRLAETRKKDLLVKAESWTVAARSVSTLGLLANRHIVCVQPKGRVAQLGCSVRNLSRNLALTGPIGGVRCNWQQLAGNPPEKQSRDAMNILLVPWPISISAKSFQSIKLDKTKWARFNLEQDWIDPSLRRSDMNWEAPPQAFNDLVEQVKTLLRRAQRDVVAIDAIVFPEMSLTANIFSSLFCELASDPDGEKLKFMIAGTKGNCEKPDGNHVMMAVNEKLLVEPIEGSLEEEESTDNAIRIFSQRKHHRWKLEKNQIATYGIGSALSPSKDWWENHEIGARELNFFQIRKDTVIASLICEDLARNDPCHDIMRSVAPNLVFALLMDGPQLISRWPARYASTLADDPGSTVITFTSFGLVDRSNDQFVDGKSRSVGLIRDSRGTTKEIVFPKEAAAVVLTLGSEKVDDYTIDGRKTTNASEWYYISQRPVKG